MLCIRLFNKCFSRVTSASRHCEMFPVFSLPSTSSKTAITQRCLCPTCMGSREFHISVHLKCGRLEDRRQNQGNNRCSACNLGPPFAAAEPTAPENQEASGEGAYTTLASWLQRYLWSQGTRWQWDLQSHPSSHGGTCKSNLPHLQWWCPQT